MAADTRKWSMFIVKSNTFLSWRLFYVKFDAYGEDREDEEGELTLRSLTLDINFVLDEGFVGGIDAHHS